MIKTCFCFLLVTMFFTAAFAQEINWWNPASSSENIIEGRFWAKDPSMLYARFPAKAEKTVPPAVWDLSKQAAGIMIRFTTNSSEITVRYQVERPIAMPHMPATGVSGVDLYFVSNTGQELWSAGKWNYKDTIEFKFSGLVTGAGEYRLYLPLYNVVKWMEIGTKQGSSFQPLPARISKPVLIYGTSIAQGACASRPGMAWTAILSRKLNQPLINLGFSGSGRLEPAVLDLVTEVDASVFVLDCLPNLTGGSAKFANDTIYNRLINAVTQIRRVHPTEPIIMTDHFGFTDSGINPAKKSDAENVNRINHQAFEDLKKKGVKNLHLLTQKELGQGMETMVDGVHPTDYGMMKYADAYYNLIKSLSLKK